MRKQQVSGSPCCLDDRLGIGAAGGAERGTGREPGVDGAARTWPQAAAGCQRAVVPREHQLALGERAPSASIAEAQRPGLRIERCDEIVGPRGVEARCELYGRTRDAGADPGGHRVSDDRRSRQGDYLVRRAVAAPEDCEMRRERAVVRRGRGDVVLDRDDRQAGYCRSEGVHVAICIDTEREAGGAPDGWLLPGRRRTACGDRQRRVRGLLLQRRRNVHADARQHRRDIVPPGSEPAAQPRTRRRDGTVGDQRRRGRDWQDDTSVVRQRARSVDCSRDRLPGASVPQLPDSLRAVMSCLGGCAVFGGDAGLVLAAAAGDKEAEFEARIRSAVEAEQQTG